MDRRLVLGVALDELESLLFGAERFMGWFPTVTRTVDDDGVVTLIVEESGIVLTGGSMWVDEQRALFFRTMDDRVGGFVTFRSLLVSGLRQGTEIWVHVDVHGRQADRLSRVIGGALDVAFAHMRMELAA